MSENNIEYVMGQRGFNLLVFRTYLFSKRSEKNGFVTWRCRIRSCRANCLLINEDED